jgi:ribosome-associated protein
MRYPKKVEIARKSLDEHKATDIVVVDVREHTPFADYYIIATVPNVKALSALADDVIYDLEKAKYETKQQEGNPESGWIIVDAGDIVIHLFIEQMRETIGLEQLLQKAGDSK